MTWVTLPVAAAAFGAFAILVSPVSSERLGARNDFDEFLGDRSLTRAVVDDRQPVDHVARVARRVVHRAQPRALSGRAVFLEPREDPGGPAARQEIGAAAFLSGRVVIERRGAVSPALKRRRDDLARGRDLADHGLEAVEEDRRDVDLARVEAPDEVACDALGHVVAHLLHLGEIDVADEMLGEVALELLAALLADGQDLHRLALPEKLGRPGPRKPHDGGVEA